MIVTENEIVHIPNPIQVKLYEAVAPIGLDGRVMSSPYRHILFGGSRGSSKSFGLRYLCHWLSLHFSQFRILFCRRTYAELENSHLAQVRQEQAKLGAHLDSKYTLTYPTGSIVQFSHCAELGDEQKQLSASWDLLVLDEETTFLTKQILDLSTSVRPSENTPKNWKPLTIGGTNPGGVSGPYAKAMFVNQNPDLDRYPDYRKENYLYIKSMLSDNPHLPYEEYKKQLQDNPEKFQAWFYGDWDAAEDQFFSEWRTGDIVENHRLLQRHVIAEISAPATADLEHFCTMEYGYKNQGVVYWIACCLDGTFLVTSEMKFKNTLMYKVGQNILSRSKHLGIVDIRYVVCDESLWNRKSDRGESLVETLRKTGLDVRRSQHDPILGWQRVRAMLAPNPKGIPFLRFITERCPYAIQTIPSLIENPTNPEDILRVPRQADAAANAIRYAAMSRPYPTVQSGAREYTRKELIGKVGELRYTMGIGQPAEYRPGRVLAGGTYRRR